MGSANSRWSAWRSFLLAVLLGTASLVADTHAQKGDAADRASLAHIKQVLWPKAYREQDDKLLDRILADEFRMIDADGNWSTKRQELEYVRKNRPGYDTFAFDIQRLELFENGTAVVAGTGTIKGADKAGKYVVRYESTNILIKRSGEWKAIASHVSGVKRVPAN